MEPFNEFNETNEQGIGRAMLDGIARHAKARQFLWIVLVRKHIYTNLSDLYPQLLA